MGSLDTYSRNPEELLISPSSQEDLGGGGLEALRVLLSLW